MACSSGWWSRTVRLGEVVTQALVLFRLRGREEREHHEERAVQHGSAVEKPTNLAMVS